MVLRGIDFGPIGGGSGALSFFGEGYWPHKVYKKLFPYAFCPELLTFCAKTMTLPPRRGKRYGEEGNLELAADGVSPKEWFPDCIKMGVRGFLGGYMANAVGLANMGARWLLDQEKWQKRTEPFFLSFASVEKERADVLLEAKNFRVLIEFWKDAFRAPFGLQVNISCPNTGIDMSTAAYNAEAQLDVFSELGIPLVLKFSTETPVNLICNITKHPACDAIIVSNTIMWGEGRYVEWNKLFGSKGVSPLARYGGGGLSGAPCLPEVRKVIGYLVTRRGFDKPIIASGGISRPRDIDAVKKIGARGVEVATALFTCPWGIRDLVERSHEVFPS